MAMRDLVTGGAACAVPGSSSSSNPLGALANTLFGSSSKIEERLREVPTLSTTTSDGNIYADPRNALPVSELDHHLPPTIQGSDFLRGFRTADHNELAHAWDEVQNIPVIDRVSDFNGPLQSKLDGPPQRVLTSFLHQFINSSQAGVPFQPIPLPVLGLSQGDKQCIRDRSTIMSRHFFADKNEEFINAQVNALLSSLDIDGDVRARGPMPGRFRELEGYWNESQVMQRPGHQAADGWVDEFSQQQIGHGDPNAWALSFERQHGTNGWASEFEREQTQIMSVNQMRGANIPNIAAIEQSSLLAHTLAQNNDPKFQNSKFLQFVSKMSRGDLVIDDNQVRPAATSSGGDWATEFQQQYDGKHTWADQFVHGELSRGPEGWANEFAAERQQRTADDQWVNEFSKLHVNDWADEFGRQVGEGVLGDDITDGWANSYDEFLNEQIASKEYSDSSRGVYVFSDMNPYVGHANPLKEGQDLFRKGLLSEAVLALEAEVLKNPNNAEGWRLLGVAHAENDDDQQAIASMMRAHEVDPTNLEILLALGVSHTNELEQAAALKYLYGWLRHHPKYKSLTPTEMSDSLFHTDVTRLYLDAAQMSPEDADVHIVLGVLYNLSREFDRAIESFQTAIKLKPQDYSLWNKLGATQANSIQSADAILAYQQALDLKPNYVRAWANMGISYANQGMYEDSIRYYVRALAMNPKADNAWQYLKISLSCASRNDMLEACNHRNIDALQKEFPL